MKNFITKEEKNQREEGGNIMNEQQGLQIGDMQQYSSTMARYFEEHCPYALHLHKSGEFEDTTHFQVGNTAHFVLQRVGESGATDPQKIEAIAVATAKELYTNGYEYFGQKHPPFVPDLAIEGRELALEYLKEHSLPQHGKFEQVLAMDSQGNACAIESARWRAKIDWHGEGYEGDGEETMFNMIVTTDYKSAWPTDETELEKLQRKSQMVLAWLHYPNMDGVRAEVINLRTGKPYSKVVMFDEDGLEQLKRWRQDILDLCDAMDKTRSARPGVGCVKCPFVDRCDEAKKVAKAADNAAALAVIENIRTTLKAKLRHQLNDSGGIQCGNGWVGYKLVNNRIVGDNARRQMLANFYEMPLDEVDTKLGIEKGFLQILDPGVTAYERFAKTRFSGEHRVEREEFMSFLDTETSVEFGIHKNNGNGNGHADALSLLPENTMLVDPPPQEKPEKPKKKKANAVMSQSNEVTIYPLAQWHVYFPEPNKPEKVRRKKIAQKKTVVRKGKGNKAKATLKKPRTKQRGRKVRK